MKIKTVWRALIGIFLVAIAPSVLIAQTIWNTSDSIPTICSQPTVSIGYLYPSKATTFSLGNSASNTFNIKSLEQTLNIQGVWTEFTLPVKSSGPLGLVVDFGYLFPVNSQSEETYNLITSGISEPAARKWNTSSQLWNFQVAATYHALRSVTAIAGFRYESFMTNYTDYEEVYRNKLLFNPQALGGTDFTFNGFIPFFGAVIDIPLVYFANAKAGVIGLPALPGSFVYKEVVNGDNFTTQSGHEWNGIQASNEFRSGYFLEAFGRVSTLMSWWAQVGAFVKYSGVYGKTTMDVTTTVARPTGSLDQRSYHNQADATFQRSSWIFGGTISANF